MTGSTAVPAGDIKNGNVSIATTTSPPPTPILGAPDCPNPQWTENITDMAFTSATIKLFQDSNEDGTVCRRRARADRDLHVQLGDV